MHRCGGPSELRGRAGKIPARPRIQRVQAPGSHAGSRRVHTGHGCQCWRSSISALATCLTCGGNGFLPVPDHAENRPTAYRCGGPSELPGAAGKFQHALEFSGAAGSHAGTSRVHTGHGCQCWRSSMSRWWLQEARHQQDMLDARIGNLSDVWWQWIVPPRVPDHAEDQLTAYRYGGPSELRGRAGKIPARPRIQRVQAPGSHAGSRRVHTKHGCQRWRSSISALATCLTCGGNGFLPTMQKIGLQRTGAAEPLKLQELLENSSTPWNSEGPRLTCRNQSSPHGARMPMLALSQFPS